MARPRKIVLEAGKEIELKNFTPEEADSIQKLLLSKTESTEVSPTQDPKDGNTLNPVGNSVAVTGVLPCEALSLVVNPTTRHWELVTVAFNPNNGEARVSEIKDVSDVHAHALGELKKAIAYKFFRG